MAQREEIQWKGEWLGLWPGHHTLVEPSLGSTPGAPDTWLAWQRELAGWLEFKHPDESGCFELRPKQRLWHRLALEHCTQVGFCIVNANGFWLMPSSLVLSAGPCVDHAQVVGHTWCHAKAEPMLLVQLVREAWARNEV